MTEEITSALTTPQAEQVEAAMLTTGIRDVPHVLHYILDRLAALGAHLSPQHELAARAVINEASRPPAPPVDDQVEGPDLLGADA